MYPEAVVVASNPEERVLFCIQAVYSTPRGETPEDAIKAWSDGKDFKVVPDGPYFSIRDLEAIYARGFTKVICYWSFWSKVPKIDTFREVVLSTKP